MRPDISWESFAINNPDARGIHYKFEDLCRQLFYYENISKNKRSKYIHSNPNNPGLEADPIFDEGNNRWIGFQAKFFENTVDFAQIKHSAQMIVEYYSGRVNHVFLFCNKPLMTKSLDETNQILRRADITLELITNDAILDLVRTKYNRLGLYYFGNHSINLEWLKNHAAKMYDELGTRFNKQFNVKTIVSQELSLFTNRKQAIDIFNTEKESI